ncbi:MAG: hypothetical protein AAGA12_06010 [Pseudomonadota bacterium]
MAQTDNFYSRFVQFAKVAFPLAALGVLSTLFLFSRSYDPDAALPFAEIDVAKIASEQLMAAPRFSGVTSDGMAVSLTAKSARPDPTDPRRLIAQDVAANLTSPDGTRYDILSKIAEYSGSDLKLHLMGNVELSTNTGFHLRTAQILSSLGQMQLDASGPVEVEFPNGELLAGSMSLLTRQDAQVLVFKNGVKLIYTAGQ